MDLSNENVIHIQEGGMEYLQFRKLLEYQDILTHAYSLGTQVNYRTSTIKKEPLKQEKYEKMMTDYKKLCKAIEGKVQNVVKTNQEHTDCIKIVKEKINKNEPDFNLEQYANTDGLITDKKNIILATTNADCILLLFFDPVRKVIANVHSGWKGTLQRISVKTVQKMKEEYGCDPQDIICCICPSIRQCHFEVDEDVKDMFEKEFRETKNYEGHKNEEKIIQENKSKHKWNIDTVLINKIILKEAGLKTENIIDSNVCSVCNSDLMHSFRVEKENYGLNVALIEMRQ